MDLLYCITIKIIQNLFIFFAANYDITDLEINKYLVNNKGCQIPDINPYDLKVRRFIGIPEPITCKYGSQLPLIDSNDSAIFVNHDARSYYYKDSESIKCWWRNFWRKESEDNKFM